VFRYLKQPLIRCLVVLFTASTSVKTSLLMFSLFCFDDELFFKRHQPSQRKGEWFEKLRLKKVTTLTRADLLIHEIRYLKIIFSFSVSKVGYLWIKNPVLLTINLPLERESSTETQSETINTSNDRSSRQYVVRPATSNHKISARQRRQQTFAITAV